MHGVLFSQRAWAPRCIPARSGTTGKPGSCLNAGRVAAADVAMDRFHYLCLMLITAAAQERLQRAETHAWTSARKALSEDQLSTLRGLIGA
jgi:hypothetical protein